MTADAALCFGANIQPAFSNLQAHLSVITIELEAPAEVKDAKEAKAKKAGTVIHLSFH
jgi:hypothetical protein